MSRAHTVLRSALVLALASALPAAAQQAPLKIAVVNLDVVALESPAGKEMQAKLEAFQQAAQAELQALKDEADEVRRRATEGANSLSQERLAELQKEFQDKAIELQRMQDDKNREGQAMQTESLKAIEQQLEPVFREISQEQGLDLILNYTPGVVIMAGQRVDITRQVIERLQAAGSGSEDSSE